MKELGDYDITVSVPLADFEELKKSAVAGKRLREFVAREVELLMRQVAVMENTPKTVEDYQRIYDQFRIAHSIDFSKVCALIEEGL